MQRRNFVKKSVAAAIVAATPLALTGLVEAAGGGRPSTTLPNTTVPDTTIADTTYYTTDNDGQYNDDCSDAEKADIVGGGPSQPKESDASGKHVKCERLLDCSNGKKCVDVYDCEEWHSSDPLVCADISIDTAE